MKTKGILLLVFLLAITMAGCGGGSDSQTLPGTDDTEISESETQSPSGDESGISYAEYLTVEEVEEITGISGLTLNEEPLMLQFLYGEEIAYEVRFYSMGFYDEEVGGNQEYYTDVPEVGDRAAIAIPDAPYRLTFAKGDYSIMTQTLSQDPGAIVTEAHLIELAKLLASRL